MSGKVVSLAPRDQNVFLILDGPDTDTAIYEVCNDPSKYVAFRVMIGAYFRQPGCHSGYIEPLLPSSFCMRVKVLAADSEHQNPYGIAIAAKILAVPNYLEQLTGDQMFYVPKLSPGRLIRMSYDLDNRSGGFAVRSDHLVVDSRSNLIRVCGQTADVYRVESDAEGEPTTSNLKPLYYYSDPYQDCF